MTCECCERTYVDEVALLAIEDAVMAFVEALRSKIDRDRDAFAEAERRTQEARRGAGG